MHFHSKCKSPGKNCRMVRIKKIILVGKITLFIGYQALLYYNWKMNIEI